MLSGRGVAGLAIAALTIAGLSACGDDAERATATGTTATTAAEPSEVPEGVAAQYAVLEEEVAEEGGSVETGDWRIVPGARITLEVLDGSGERVEKKPLSFYHAEFFHYAENFRIPSDGEYTLRATVETPQFRRHGDESEGPELMDDAQVEFENVMIDADA